MLVGGKCCENWIAWPDMTDSTDPDWVGNILDWVGIIHQAACHTCFLLFSRVHIWAQVQRWPCCFKTKHMARIFPTQLDKTQLHCRNTVARILPTVLTKHSFALLSKLYIKPCRNTPWQNTVLHWTLSSIWEQILNTICWHWIWHLFEIE